MFKRKVIFIQIALLSSALSVFSQEALKSIEEDYYDFLSLEGITKHPTLGYRTLSDNIWNLTEDNTNNKVTGRHPWENNNLGHKWTLWQDKTPSQNWFAKGINQNIKIKIYGPSWFNSYNTMTPYGQNDGALWQGRGYNSSFTTGARLEAYGFELTFKPQITFSQNKDFDYLPGVYGDKHSYFWAGNIDLVQRYGDTSYWQYDWGDSELRWSWRTFTVGFGTQSPWLGPAWLNPMLGSNNAGTYPKFDFGLRRTDIYSPSKNIYFGSIEGRMWIGQSSNSDYYKPSVVLDKKLITGFNLSVIPGFFKNLTIGATKVCIAEWNKNSIKYLNPLYHDNTLNSIGEDQKMSVYADILFPEVGFEVWGEFGRDDYAGYKLHTAIYSIGAKKTFRFSKLENQAFELIAEWNNFEMSQDFQMQWKYMGYYAHGSDLGGYTQNGQILGAGSGYFGNNLYLALKYYHKRGSVTAAFQKSFPDLNYVYNMSVGTSINSESEEYKKYYHSYREYWGCSLASDFFITDSFIVTGFIDGKKVSYYFFDADDSPIYNVHFGLNLKYNF